jgi:hypothetical protein
MKVTTATRCRRCGSTERRPNNKGCVPCHRNASRAQWRRRLEAEQNFPITPAMRAYLAAFDAYLAAVKTGDPRELQATTAARRQSLARLEASA